MTPPQAYVSSISDQPRQPFLLLPSRAQMQAIRSTPGRQPRVIKNRIGGAVVLDREDMVGVLKDAKTFSSRVMPVPLKWVSETSEALRWHAAAEMVDQFLGSVAFSDAQAHQQNREDFTRTFRPKVLRGMQGKFAEEAEGLLLDLDGTTFDIRQDFADPFTFNSIFDFTGVPDDPAHRDFLQTSVDTFVGFVANPFSANGFRNLMPFLSSFRQTLIYINGLLDEAQKGNAPISPMVAPYFDDNGKLLPEMRAHAVTAIGTALIVGTETSRGTIANATHLLVSHPHVLEQLHNGEINLMHVFEETLRLYPPLANALRITTRDTEVGGFRLAAGTRVFNPFLAAGTAAIYERPFDFEPIRWKLNPGLPKSISFGLGVHACPGARLAWIEFEAAMKVHTSPLVKLEAAGPARSMGAVFLDEMASVPVTVSGVEQYLAAQLSAPAVPEFTLAG